MKNLDLKIRISEEDNRRIQYCQEKLGLTKSEVIRKAVKDLEQAIIVQERKSAHDSRIYIEETHRKATGYYSILSWNRGELIEIISQQLDRDSAAEREIAAERMVERLDMGESITFGKDYVSTYRVGSPEDLINADIYRELENKETDALPPLDYNRTKAILEEYRKNHADKKIDD